MIHRPYNSCWMCHDETSSIFSFVFSHYSQTLFVSDPLRLSLLVFLSLNICSSVIVTTFGEINRFKILAPCLTYLNISGLRINEMFDVGCVIELATPSLEYFKNCDSDLYYFYSEINISLMEEIDINVGWFTKNNDLLFCLVELFEIIRIAKFISLWTEIIKVSILSFFFKYNI